MERGNRKLQYLIVSAVTTSAVAMGALFSWGTPVLPKFVNNEVGFIISNSELSWMLATSSIGFMTGSSVARFTSDKCGRRFTLLASSLPITVGAVLMILAWEVLMLSLSRFLFGCGAGMMGAVASLYIAEIADKEIRGSLSLSHRFMFSLGCLLMITVGAFVSYRTINYMQLAMPALYVAACWWIPESPYYLLKEGKVDAARKTLQMLTGIRDEDVLEERLTAMNSHVRTEMTRSSSVKEFITGKRYRKGIIIVIGLKTTQLMTGLHPIQNYLGLLVQESNSELNVTLTLIIFGTVRFLLGIMSSLLVDRTGRRPLLIYSFCGTGVFLATVAAYFIFHDPASGLAKFPYNLIPFVGIIFALTTAMLGYESLGFLMPAELFPMNVKAIAMTMNSIFGGIVNFVSVKSYQPLKDLFGLSGVFSLFALFSFSGALFSYFYVIETKGKSLKEIQVEIQGNIYVEEDKLYKVVADLDGEMVSPLKENNDNDRHQGGNDIILKSL